MIKTESINPDQLTEEDIRWLVLGCKESVDGAQAIDQVHGAVVGQSFIFRITGEAEGVFVLTRDGKNMTITALAGKGFFKHFQSIHEQILTTAAAYGAKAVAGYVTRRGLGKMYRDKTKARMAAYFIEDLS